MIETKKNIRNLEGRVAIAITVPKKLNDEFLEICDDIPFEMVHELELMHKYMYVAEWNFPKYFTEYSQEDIKVLANIVFAEHWFGYRFIIKNLNEE